MPVKESSIETTIMGGVEGSTKIPVQYTDEFLETSVFNFAFSSAIGDFLPYLFVGFFNDGKDFKKWFFSNARRHQEMQTAIENDIGKGMQYVWGQIWFDEARREVDGSLIFKRLTLTKAIPDQDEAISLLKEKISADHISSNFKVLVR